MHIAAPPSTTQSELVAVKYAAVSVALQSMAYGIYAFIMPFSSYILLKKGLGSATNRLMFGITIFMFLLSSCYWCVSVINITLKIRRVVHINELVTWESVFPLFNAIVYINYVLGDAIVVWRAWTLSLPAKKKLLAVPIICLVITAVSTCASIGLRSGLVQIEILQGVLQLTSNDPLGRALDITQVISFLFSLFTNIFATSIIAHRAWVHRGFVQNNHQNRGSRTEKIMIIVVESGLGYCVLGTILLVSSFTHLPHGTLGDVYIPVSIHIAGIFPTLILVIVGFQRSIGEMSSVSGRAGTSQVNGSNKKSAANSATPSIQPTHSNSEEMNEHRVSQPPHE